MVLYTGWRNSARELLDEDFGSVNKYSYYHCSTDNCGLGNARTSKWSSLFGLFRTIYHYIWKMSLTFLIMTPLLCYLSIFVDVSPRFPDYYW